MLSQTLVAAPLAAGMPLAAGLADIIQALLPIVAGLGWMIWQFIAAQAEAKNQKKPPRRPAPDPGDVPRPEGVGQQQELRSEVEDFLRKLQNPNADKEPPAPAPPRRPMDDQPPRRPRRPRVEVLVDEEPPRPERDEPRRVVTKPEPSPSKPRRQSTAQSVADQATKLRQQVAGTDTQVHAKFDDATDHLADRITEAADHAYDEPAYDTQQSENAKPTPAEQIAAMLRDPDSVRNAVILNEILTRRG